MRYIFKMPDANLLSERTNFHAADVRCKIFTFAEGNTFNTSSRRPTH